MYSSCMAVKRLHFSHFGTNGNDKQDVQQGLVSQQRLDLQEPKTLMVNTKDHGQRQHP